MGIEKGDDHNFENFVAKNSRLNPQRLRLEGYSCPVCGTRYLDGRPVCPNCSLKKPQPVSISTNLPAEVSIEY